MTDVDEPIEALLTNKAYEYAARKLGITRLSSELYRRVFTVRRPEVEAYLERHQLRLADYAANYFWLNRFRRGEKWIVSEYYPPERSPAYEQAWEFATEREARRALLDKILQSSQTGISF